MHESATGPASTGCLPSALTSSLSRSYGASRATNIPHNASQDTHRPENHMCYTCVYATLRGSGLQVLIKHRCIEKWGNKRAPLLLSSLFPLTWDLLSTWNRAGEGRGVCVRGCGRVRCCRDLSRRRPSARAASPLTPPPSLPIPPRCQR